MAKQKIQFVYVKNISNKIIRFGGGYPALHPNTCGAFSEFPALAYFISSGLLVEVANLEGENLKKDSTNFSDAFVERFYEKLHKKQETKKPKEDEDDDIGEF